jgi:hypothetical protein
MLSTIMASAADSKPILITNISTDVAHFHLIFSNRIHNSVTEDIVTEK